METSSSATRLISSNQPSQITGSLPFVPAAIQPFTQVTAESKPQETPKFADAGERDTTSSSTGEVSLDDQRSGLQIEKFAAPHEAEQPGLLSRIWRFVKGKFYPNSPLSIAPKLSQSDRPPLFSAPSVAAGERIAERRRKRAMTKATLSAVREFVAASEGDVSEKLLLRVTGLRADVQYVRAIDLLNAETNNQKTVPVCTKLGEPISLRDAAPRRSLTVYEILAAQVDLVPPPEKQQILKSDVVTPAPEGSANEDVIDVSPYEPSREITPGKTTEEQQSL